MTNIEKIKQARQDLDVALWAVHSSVRRGMLVPEVDMQVLINASNAMCSAQAEALRQATEVADENFARAQKLSEQVQENVRHIERLAERRSDEDMRIVEALQAVIDYGVMTGPDWVTDRVNLALALAKGEAV